MSKQYHGTYDGKIKELRGKRALLIVEEHEVQDMVPAHGQIMARTCTAQFDDLDTPYSHGWHSFPITDFVLEYEYTKDTV